MTITVQQLLDKKGSNIFSVTPDTFVFDAIKIMDQVSVGALLVVENNQLVGIVSERDYARKVILKDRQSHNTPVRDIMTSTVLSVTPHQSVDECLMIMSKNHIRHLPVLENGQPIGILSVMDVVKNILSEKESLIQQLENYISGVG